MKATEQYFPVVLFLTLHKAVLLLSLFKHSVVITQMKATAFLGVCESVEEII